MAWSCKPSPPRQAIPFSSTSAASWGFFPPSAMCVPSETLLPMSMQPTAVLYFVRSLALLSLPRGISALHALITADHLSATVTASRERFGLRQNGIISSRLSRSANLARPVLWNYPTCCLSSIGALRGLVMVEWNAAAPETESVGIWDTHVRIGDAIRIKLLAADRPHARMIQTESPYF